MSELKTFEKHFISEEESSEDLNWPMIFKSKLVKTINHEHAIGDQEIHQTNSYTAICTKNT